MIEVVTPQFEALEFNNPDSEWTLPDGTSIYLFTLEQLKILSAFLPNTILTDIFGQECRAKDADTDTRFGYVAYGARK